MQSPALTVPVSREWQTVTIPFSEFTSKWSAYTGEPTVKCSDDASVCPDRAHLAKLTDMEIAAEGVAGKFHLEVKSVSAVRTSAGSPAQQKALMERVVAAVMSLLRPI